MDLEVQRYLTKAFIEQYPEMISFIPRRKERKPAGGYVFVEEAPRAPQKVTFIEPGNDPTPMVTLDGVDREVVFEVLGAHDAHMARHDVFTHKNREWEIVEMFYDNGYETRALVSGRG